MKVLMKIQKLGLIPLLFFLFTVNANSNTLKMMYSNVQTNQEGITISGMVRDEANNPIVGVQIIEIGANNGVITDVQGKFKLSIRKKGSLVRVSSMGYELFEMTVNESKGDIKIVLKENVKKLDELVVIGYGTMKKRDVSGSISSINSESLENTPVKNLMSAIQGRASGVQVVSSSGAPGDGMSVIVRGQSTLNSGNDPLYVIDGVPVETNSLSKLNGYESHGLNPLADINPQDIESIEILKDGSSTAIYGSRAANGVILITTKRGKEGKPQINLNVYAGVSNITRKLSVLNASQWREIIIDSYKNLDAYNNATTPIEPHWPAIDSLNPLNRKEKDWYDMM